MAATSYSLTPDSVSIQPEPQDFEAVEKEFGPLPLDASEQEAAHRYRLAQAMNNSKDFRFESSRACDALSIVPRVRGLRAFEKRRGFARRLSSYVDKL